MDEDVEKVVAETMAKIESDRKKDGKQVVVGSDLIEGQVRDNEIQAAGKKRGGGEAGQDVGGEKVEGLKSWQVYWDVSKKAYVFNDPRIVTPMGTMVIQSVDIEANKTYTAQIWQDDKGVWNAEIVTKVEPKSGAKFETSVQIAAVGEQTGPNQIQQNHIGAIVVTSAGGASEPLMVVKVDNEIKRAKYIEFLTASAPEEGGPIPLPKVELDGDEIKVTFFTTRISYLTKVEYKDGVMRTESKNADVVLTYQEDGYGAEVFRTVNHSDLVG